MTKKINTLLNFWKKNPEKMLFRNYLLALAVTLFFHLFMGLTHLIAYQTNFYESRSLALTELEPVGIELVDDGTIITQTDDSQLIYTGNIRSIKIKCEFLQDPGEFVSFYNKKANGAFGSNQMMYAKMQDGYYVFDYPLGTRQARIDFGVVPSVTVHISEILLNDKDPAQMLGYTNGELFYLFTVPLVVFLLLDTLLRLWCEIKPRLKSKK